MKQHQVINNANSWVINILAFSKVHQVIEIRDRHTNQKVCDDLILHATVLYAKSYKGLSISQLEIIREVVIKELETYDSWDDIALQLYGDVVLY